MLQIVGGYRSLSDMHPIGGFRIQVFSPGIGESISLVNRSSSCSQPMQRAKEGGAFGLIEGRFFRPLEAAVLPAGFKPRIVSGTDVKKRGF